GREVMRKIINRAKLQWSVPADSADSERAAQRGPCRIVFPEGDNEKILRACQVIVDEGLARPILLGNPEKIRAKIKELDLSLGDVEIIRPLEHPRSAEFIAQYQKMRERKGMTEF